MVMVCVRKSAWVIVNKCVTLHNVTPNHYIFDLNSLHTYNIYYVNKSYEVFSISIISDKLMFSFFAGHVFVDSGSLAR